MSALKPALALASSMLLAVSAAKAQAPLPHNVILFVPDGLRALSVTPETAPAMAAIRDRGVNFRNPHSLFPTFTMANSSGMSTGHLLGDTGVFSNTIFSGYPVAPANNTVTPFLENDAVLHDVDAHFGGDFVNEETLLRAARASGLSTAAVGKVGPAEMFDHTDQSGMTIVVDDLTGTPSGIALSPEMKEAITAAGLPLATPGRGDNGKVGDFKTPGTTVPNAGQQKYFADVAAKVVLPMLKARNKPFVLVFWSRDPDGTQHNQGDSLNSLTPGINGPTSRAAIKNADDNLKELQDALHDLGLDADTNILVAADHGFSTIAKESQTSAAAKGEYADVPKGALPPGFLAIDLAKGLGLPLFDPDAKNASVPDNSYPKVRGNGVIGENPEKPTAVVAANGNSDLVYLPSKDPALAKRVVDLLLAQDYMSGLFVDDDLGDIPGTLPLSAIGLKGSARTPRPAIVVNFRSFSTGCDQAVLCSANVADTPLQQGQGMHGSMSRADTMNFMAAMGPDFKTGVTSDVPVSNADFGKTLAKILNLDIPSHGTLVGRVIEEALPSGVTPSVTSMVVHSAPAANGLQTAVAYQQVGTSRYLDAGGFPGKTVGLPAEMKSQR